MSAHEPNSALQGALWAPHSALLNRLWFRLIAAFALVIVVSLIVTVLLARQGAETQFAHFMVNDQMIRPERLQQALAAHYQRADSWSGLAAALPALIVDTSDGTMTGVMGSVMGMYNNRIQVVDAQGAVVADTAGEVSDPAIASAQVQHWPILIDQQPVGALLVEGSMMQPTLSNNALLDGVTRAVLVAGLVAGVAGLALAGLLVRQITRPLVTLTAASARIAAGDRAVRVPVQNRNELGELAATFNQMAFSLETQERLRRNLMADIAHELRTPLTGIQGTVEAMQDGVFPLTTANLNTIHEQILLLNRLVEDLRTLANAEAGQLTLHRTSVNLAALCQRHSALFQPQATAQGVQLSLHTDGAPPLIQVDEQRLGQVLNNLLDNALRHTPAGGTIGLCLSATGEDAQITIFDSGAGVALIDLPHIFDRFYRAEPSSNRQMNGAGLGLAIARQLVEAHGGSIGVLSPPPGKKQGTQFVIALPRAAA